MNNSLIAKIRTLSKTNSSIPFEKDEWEAWRENAVTQWFLDEFIAQAADDAKKTFVDHAWGRREVDAIYHAALFERSKVLTEMREVNYDNLYEAK